MTKSANQIANSTVSRFAGQGGARMANHDFTASEGNEIRLVVGVAKPQDIAHCLLQLAASEDEPDHLTHLRIQKLMYYIQGWSLARRGRPAFSGRIEAWAHGPVVKELYPLLADYGDQPIPSNALANKASRLSAEDSEFVATVWNAYREFTAFALRNMTHNEAPWIVARGNTPSAEVCHNEITQEAMSRYFGQQP